MYIAIAGVFTLDLVFESVTVCPTHIISILLFLPLPYNIMFLKKVN